MEVQDPNSLLLRITRCPVAERCLAGEPLACADIVGTQSTVAPDLFQVPEPWSGHIETAQILFISSNPSIDHHEVYPTKHWTDEQRIAFFQDRFAISAQPYVDSRMRGLLAGEPPSYPRRGTRFWQAARARASDLLGRQAEPGRDFALTEVVHCKSLEELGVGEALSTCVKLWLRPVLSAARARVIVIFGDRARSAMNQVYGIAAGAHLIGPRDVEGLDRIILQLPHPNARTRRAGCAPLTAAEMDLVGRFLAARHET